MMNDLPRKIARGATAMSLCLGLGGCVTTRPTAPADLGVLTTALTEPVEALRGQSDAGQAGAQYAMSVLHAYGLRGATVDQEQAARLRRQALATRGFTPITTYIAGLNGKPGRVATIYIPRYELNAGQALRIDQCAAALARGDESRAATEACAGSQEFTRLKALWNAVKSRN